MIEIKVEVLTTRNMNSQIQTHLNLVLTSSRKKKTIERLPMLAYDLIQLMANQFDIICERLDQELANLKMNKTN